MISQNITTSSGQIGPGLIPFFCLTLGVTWRYSSFDVNHAKMCWFVCQQLVDLVKEDDALRTAKTQQFEAAAGGSSQSSSSQRLSDPRRWPRCVGLIGLLLSEACSAQDSKTNFSIEYEDKALDSGTVFQTPNWKVLGGVNNVCSTHVRIIRPNRIQTQTGPSVKACLSKLRFSKNDQTGCWMPKSLWTSLHVTYRSLWPRWRVYLQRSCLI